MVVTQVKSGSAAARKGIREGMVILEVNREEVTDVGEFNIALAESADEKKVLLLVDTGRYAQYVVLELRD